MKRTTLATFLAVITLLALALAWAFAPRPVDVETASAREGPFLATIDEDGRTRLRDRYVVSAPLAGQVSRLPLREGDAVAAEAVVAIITPPLPAMLDERTLREQQLRVESAEAQVQRADARVAGAQVALEQARLQYMRSEELSHQGFVAVSKLDVDRLAGEAAQKDLEALLQERHAATHDLEQARAALAAVQQKNGGALRAFQVRAPVSGRVLRILQSSENAVPLGTPLLEIGDIGRLEVVAELLTTDAVRARPGSRVLIERWGGDRVLEGRVRLVEPGGFTKVSALGVEEQRVNVVIDIASPFTMWQALGDGFRVGVRIVVQDEPHVLQVPVSAVFPRPQEGGDAVLRLEAGRARLVPVAIVGRNGRTAWVREGLRVGDTVIVYPPPSVVDGARVRSRTV